MVTAPAVAEDRGGATAAAGPVDRSTLAVIWENDVYAGTDRNYTNGLRASFVSPGRAPGPSIHRRVAGVLLQADAADTVRYGVAVGHSIYTPVDIDASAPLPDQHPYAGLVYAEYSLFASGADSLRIAALQVGLVGPAAGAGVVQNGVHRVIDSTRARGWANQLHNEPVFALMLERRERVWLERRLLGYGFDVTPHWGLSLGTLRTQVKAGATIRFGSDLRNDFGPPRIRPALGGSGYFEDKGGFSWYLFAGADARGVARDLVLDGNTFRDSARVSRIPFVADFQGGLVLSYGRYQLAYTYVTRTREFDSQQDAQRFGSLSLSTKVEF